MSYEIEYLHVLFFDDVKFYASLVKGIDANLELKPNKHVFVTDKIRVYDAIKNNTNCFLIDYKMLKKYMLKSKWIVFHAFPIKKWEFCLLPKSLCKRIIWRTWGHDIRPFNTTNNVIYDLLKYIEFSIFKKKIQSIYAMGVANEVDIVNIEQVYKHSFKYFELHYSDYFKVYDYLHNTIVPDANNRLTVMVGHNCSPVDNHLEIFDKLSKYKKEDMLILIPLSYSDPKNGYKEKVIIKACKLFGENNVKILNDFIPLEEYIKLIATIDIAIMDMHYSNGLDNISYFLYFEKKLYIKEGSNLDEAFKRKGIHPNYTKQIGVEPFEQFKTNIFDKKYLCFCKDLNDKNSFKNKWIFFLNELGNFKNE